MPKINIDSLRKIEFSKPYNWEISFPEFGAEIFPAFSYSDTAFTFASESMDFGANRFSIPSAPYSPGLNASLEIYELQDFKLYKWLKDWYNLITKSDFTIRLLGETVGAQRVAKEMLIERLSSDNINASDVQRVLVIPDGDVTYSFSSEKGGTPISVSLNLIVVGS